MRPLDLTLLHCYGKCGISSRSDPPASNKETPSQKEVSTCQLLCGEIGVDIASSAVVQSGQCVKAIHQTPTSIPKSPLHAPKLSLVTLQVYICTIPDRIIALKQIGSGSQKHRGYRQFPCALFTRYSVSIVEAPDMISQMALRDQSSRCC